MFHLLLPWVSPASVRWSNTSDQTLSIPWHLLHPFQQRNMNTLTREKSADSSCDISTILSDNDVCVAFVQSSTPETLVPSTVTSENCSVLTGALVGCEEVQYRTVLIHQAEEALRKMCCHMNMAWLHLFSLDIAHPPSQRDVSTTKTRMSLREAQFQFASQSPSAFTLTCSSSVRTARSAGFA